MAADPVEDLLLPGGEARRRHRHFGAHRAQANPEREQRGVEVGDPGEPYLARPPLIYAAGALAIKALAPPLERPSAARLVAGVALALILLVTAQASRELNGRALRWLPVLILIAAARTDRTLPFATFISADYEYDRISQVASLSRSKIQ